MTPHQPIDTPEGLTILAERFRVWSEVAVNPAQRANLLEIAESYAELSRQTLNSAARVARSRAQNRS